MLSDYDIATVARIERRTIRDASGCWLFVGGHNHQGYVSISYHHRKVIGHRLVWTLAHERPIGAGIQIHHVCGNKGCINPAHLMAVTPRQHFVGLTPRNVGYKNSRKTHCPRGHPLVGDNLVPSQLRAGKRTCAICSRETIRQWAQDHPDRVREKAVRSYHKCRPNWTPERIERKRAADRARYRLKVALVKRN